MTRAEAVWHANHVFNLVIERCINAQNLKDAREFDEAKQIVIEALGREPKWIPVSERLPDDGKWAIWCSKDGVIGIARFKEDDCDHFYPNETSFELEDAVAWMPLPEPYEGSDEQ